MGMMVTRFAWIAHKLVSSNKPTRYASDASCNARTADDWNRRSVLKSCAISRTSLWKGNLRINNSVLFWYLRISRRATVPGLYRCGFFTPPVAGADFRAALVANCLRGALPPVDLRAVCFVRAIVYYFLLPKKIYEFSVCMLRKRIERVCFYFSFSLLLPTLYDSTPRSPVYSAYISPPLFHLGGGWGFWSLALSLMSAKGLISIQTLVRAHRRWPQAVQGGIGGTQ